MSVVSRKRDTLVTWFLMPDAGSVMFIPCCWDPKIPTLNCFLLVPYGHISNAWSVGHQQDIQSNIFDSSLHTHGRRWEREKTEIHFPSSCCPFKSISWLLETRNHFHACIFCPLHSIYFFCCASFHSHSIVSFPTGKESEQENERKKTPSRHSLFWFLVHMVPTPHCVNEKCVRREGRESNLKRQEGNRSPDGLFWWASVFFSEGWTILCVALLSASSEDGVQRVVRRKKYIRLTTWVKGNAFAVDSGIFFQTFFDSKIISCLWNQRKRDGERLFVSSSRKVLPFLLLFLLHNKIGSLYPSG